MLRVATFRRWIGLFSLGAAFIAFVVMRIFLWKDSTQNMAALQKETLAALARQTVLPEGTPWVERIADADARRMIQSDFYRDAQIGDFVIHFPDRVMLFRPQTHALLAEFRIATSTK